MAFDIDLDKSDRPSFRSKDVIKRPQRDFQPDTRLSLIGGTQARQAAMDLSVMNRYEKNSSAVDIGCSRGDVLKLGMMACQATQAFLMRWIGFHGVDTATSSRELYQPSRELAR